MHCCSLLYHSCPQTTSITKVHRICNCSTDQIHHGVTIAYGHYTSVTTIRGALYLFDDEHVCSADAHDLLHPNVVAVVLRLLSPQEVAALPEAPVVAPVRHAVVGVPAHLVIAAPARKYAAAAPVPVRKAAAPIVAMRTAVGTSAVVEVRQGDWRACAQGSAVVSPSNASFRHGAGLAFDIDQCAGTAYVDHCATLGRLTDSRVQVNTGFE